MTLDFISTKLVGSTRLEHLSQEAVVFLDFSLQHADCYLGSAQAVHQLVVSKQPTVDSQRLGVLLV